MYRLHPNQSRYKCFGLLLRLMMVLVELLYYCHFHCSVVVKLHHYPPEANPCKFPILQHKVCCSPDTLLRSYQRHYRKGLIVERRKVAKIFEHMRKIQFGVKSIPTNISLTIKTCSHYLYCNPAHHQSTSNTPPNSRTPPESKSQCTRHRSSIPRHCIL